ncbi:MAG: hypothetical protein U9R07_02600 [Pseudomonadota bacterium]|nr:hypothetical protein [Pseudomonadota bacterium]
MATNFTYPGVYINERPSGLRAIPSAATSVALFIGMADQGPMRSPVRVQSLAEYQRAFGATSAGEMADQVSQFFINGGGDAYVLRIAKDDRQASVEVKAETGGGSVLKLYARDSGIRGNNLRVVIDYATSSPERTFNLTVFRSTQKPDGSFERTETERFADLSMDRNSARYVVNQINGPSKLLTVEDKVSVTANEGASVGGVIFNTFATTGKAELAAAITATSNSFIVSVNNLAPVVAVVDTAGLNDTNVLARIGDAIKVAVNSVHSVTPSVTADLLNFGTGGLLWIKSANGPVRITPAADKDLAAKLMLGEANGGIELDDSAKVRPAPSGLFSRIGTQTGSFGVGWLDRLNSFASATRSNLTGLQITDPGSSSSPFIGPVTIPGTAGNPLSTGTVAGVAGAIGSLGYVREALQAMVDGARQVAGERWLIELQGVRLNLRLRDTFNPGGGADATVLSGILVPGVSPAPPTISGGYEIAGSGRLMGNSANNTGAILLGTAGGSFQTGQQGGYDGLTPQLTQYQAAFDIAETAIEIVNMLVLPRADGQTDTDRRAIWGAASASAARQRAILFVDPLSTWTDIATAEAGASTIKAGVDTRNSVVFWPQVLVPTATAPQGKKIDPSGSMAGLFARTDSRFGTWTAPAGLEATLTGVLGVSVQMNDPQNGRINPKALNAIRNYPSGITSWGARMMVGADDTGNMDDRYVNVRRMMLFIENSLYRGLRFATFKNNAEPLWASIRLAAGSFMNGLMLQDAFASRTKSEAYYVICDETINPPDDVAKGIVKVLVGFAPNRPAEFVEVTVTQIVQQAAA